MIQVFFGSNLVEARDKADSFLASFRSQGIKIERLSDENFVPGILEDYAGGASLFGEEQVVVVDTPSSKKEFEAAVKIALPLLAESANTFVIIEGSLLAVDRKRLEKYATEITECAAQKGERFNAFSLADALAARDKKTLWLLLQTARTNGFSDEEIIGTLWWQLKTMRLVGMSDSAEEAGLKPFVYQKARRTLSKFTTKDLSELSAKLLTLYHEGHNGTRELDLALERWVLTL